jgi:hypothetical protein
VKLLTMATPGCVAVTGMESESQVPEHDLQHRVAIPGVPELVADHLVVRFPCAVRLSLPVVRCRRGLVKLHVAKHEHGPDHLLRRQPAVHGRAEDVVEHRLEVGVHVPLNPLHEAELRDEQAQRTAHLHWCAVQAPGHIADGDAAAQRPLLAEVLHHADPL